MQLSLQRVDWGYTCFDVSCFAVVVNSNCSQVGSVNDNSIWQKLYPNHLMSSAHDGAFQLVLIGKLQRLHNVIDICSTTEFQARNT